MKTFKINDINDLKVGDMVRNLGTGQTFIIIEKSRNLITGIRSVNITNANEWEKLY